MIDMNPNLFTKDIYIGKVAGQLNSVYIFSTMDSNLKLNLKNTVTSSEFYINRKGDKVKGLIIIIDGTATLKCVYLEGEMTLKDIQNIMLYQNTRLNGNVYHIPGIELADTKVWKRLI